MSGDPVAVERQALICLLSLDAIHKTIGGTKVPKSKRDELRDLRDRVLVLSGQLRDLRDDYQELIA